ncbi:MAG TPA: hypothetical protein VL403_02500 [Candidatus Kryptonia bacterium]|nr:hypothetical protein [Candidatus Kryptonia bacterium]
MSRRRPHEPERLRLRSIAAVLLVLVSCTPPIRQFDLKDQPMTCDEANRFAYDALKAMGYTITTFTPAAAGGSGIVKGTIEEGKRSGSVTVEVSCTGAGPTIYASEDGKLLGQLEFRRAFYMNFTGVVSQRRALDQAAKEQAALPLAQRKQQGLEVLITPARGLDARLELHVDLTPAGVLPVRIAINNRTGLRYQLDPEDIVMVRADGERIGPLTVDAVMERVRSAATAPANDETPPPDLSAVLQQLQSMLFTTTDLPPDASAKGFLFYPLDTYQRARARITESQSEETEGFVVEF